MPGGASSRSRRGGQRGSQTRAFCRHHSHSRGLHVVGVNLGARNRLRRARRGVPGLWGPRLELRTPGAGNGMGLAFCRIHRNGQACHTHELESDWGASWGGTAFREPPMGPELEVHRLHPGTQAPGSPASPRGSRDGRGLLPVGPRLRAVLIRLGERELGAIEDGRRWMRAELERPLQVRADACFRLCPSSVEALGNVRFRMVGPRTVSGAVESLGKRRQARMRGCGRSGGQQGSHPLLRPCLAVQRQDSHLLWN